MPKSLKKAGWRAEVNNNIVSRPSRPQDIQERSASGRSCGSATRSPVAEFMHASAVRGVSLVARGGLVIAHGVDLPK